MRCKNTLQKGSVRYVVFRDGETWYGAGLEFNIVETGDTPQEAMLLLFEAIQGYVESAQKIKARPYILNQKPDFEYERMWQSFEECKKTRTSNVFTAGSLNIGIFVLVASYYPIKSGFVIGSGKTVGRFFTEPGFVLNHTRG